MTEQRYYIHNNYLVVGEKTSRNAHVLRSSAHESCSAARVIVRLLNLIRKLIAKGTFTGEDGEGC